MNDFAEKCYLIVGGTGAIGREVLASLRSRGATTVVADYPYESDGASRRVDIPLDLSNPRSVEDGLGEYFSSYPVPDGMVIASGMYPAARFRDMKTREIERLFMVNSLAPALLLSRYAKELERICGRGTAVITSSKAAERFQVGTAAYSGSKAALNALVQSLSLELFSGLRMNIVSPGYVSSGSTLNSVPPEYEEEVKSRIVENGLCQPKDLVSTYLWLLDDSSRWVRGTIVSVDGGASLGSPHQQAWLR